jgi:hypothetical protein
MRREFGSHIDLFVAARAEGSAKAVSVRKLGARGEPPRHRQNCKFGRAPSAMKAGRQI